MQVQTRSEDNGLRNFSSVKEAFDHANEDRTVWKVSFNAEDGTRVRFVKVGGNIRTCVWEFQPIELPEI